MDIRHASYHDTMSGAPSFQRTGCGAWLVHWHRRMSVQNLPLQ